MANETVKVFVKRAFRHFENGKLVITKPGEVLEISAGAAADVISAQKAEKFNESIHKAPVKK